MRKFLASGGETHAGKTLHIYIYIYIYIYIFNNRTGLEYDRMAKVSRTKYVFHITIYFGIIYTFISGLN